MLSLIRKLIPDWFKVLVDRVKLFLKGLFFEDIPQFFRELWLWPMRKTPAQIAEYRKGIKVYDVFTFFNELDLLEIRMNILDPYVDYFVIIECNETFTGKPKPLHYVENKDRFKKFEKKIIHYVTTDVPKDEEELAQRLSQKNLAPLDREILTNTSTTDNYEKGETHWMKEFYQKECIKRALVDLNDNDICFVSDVDEIWNYNKVVDFSRDDIFKFKQSAYVYYLNNRSNEDWHGWTGTIVTKYKNIKHACLNHLRTASKMRYTVIKDGGWHFTFQGGAAKIKSKLESYGHQEINTTEIKSNIESTIEDNKDIRGRGLKFWVDTKSLPQYLLDNRDKYAHMFKHDSHA